MPDEQTNPPQGHPITTLRALRVCNYLPNMALRHQCAEKGSWARRSQTHRTTHAPWLLSRHQDHPFVTLRGIGCSSKLPVHSYQNAANVLSSLRRGRSGPRGPFIDCHVGCHQIWLGILLVPASLGHVLLPVSKSRAESAEKLEMSLGDM